MTLPDDWSARVKAALDEIEPSDREKAIVRQAIQIRKAYAMQIQEVVKRLKVELGISHDRAL